MSKKIITNFNEYLEGNIDFENSIFLEYELSEEFIQDYRDFCNDNLDLFLNNIIKEYNYQCYIWMYLYKLEEYANRIIDNEPDYLDFTLADLRILDSIKLLFPIYFNAGTNLFNLIYSICKNIHPYLNINNVDDWFDILFPNYINPKELINMYKLNYIEDCELKNYIVLKILDNDKYEIDTSIKINKFNTNEDDWNKFQEFSCVYNFENYGKSHVNNLKDSNNNLICKKVLIDFGKFNRRFEHNDDIRFKGLLITDRKNIYKEISHIHEVKIISED